jgi:hypothetical protein
MKGICAKQDETMKFSGLLWETHSSPRLCRRFMSTSRVLETNSSSLQFGDLIGFHHSSSHEEAGALWLLGIRNP